MRDVSPKGLATILVCAGGGLAAPRGGRLSALSKRLISGEDFTSTLSGARIVAEGDTVIVGREPGDLRRCAVPDVALEPGRAVVWDGRYELTAREPGWTVTAALGRLARLSPADRKIVRRAPAWARGALPVLYREDGGDTVLAGRRAEVRNLAPRRLKHALGETTQEADLFLAVHGETPPTDLFSFEDNKHDAPHGPPRDREP
ncbi:MAG: hypothetical protein EON88_31520 [Brevundimonas sp.]|nr:MAG: hypothetical protein EON88_31520 [Brevundimonas sp.]